MLKINLWKWCKVPQIKLKVLQIPIQAQGPAVQNQVQGPAVQIQVQGPVNNNAQVGQNIPMQLPQQPAPAQPVPTGLVVPAPQVVYQNWIRKKPEFSG